MGKPLRVCLVAILKNEENFIHEWIAYHRLLGVDHFFLYDDDPELPLARLLRNYRDFVTVIDWTGADIKRIPGRNRQTKAYMDSLNYVRGKFDWVSFLDGDEFIVLRKDRDLKHFLRRFSSADQIFLNWHVFGHNGFFDDPQDLVTKSLTRRMLQPSRLTKIIIRPEKVVDIDSAHYAHKVSGSKSVNSNGRHPSLEDDARKIARAHVNHYMCRSFRSWMNRVKLGAVAYDGSSPVPGDSAWRFDKKLCLKEFVETIAKDKNECVDTFMLRFEESIKQWLARNQ